MIKIRLNSMRLSRWARQCAQSILMIWCLAWVVPAMAESERFVIQLNEAVELSSQPSVRTLEAMGERLDEILARNGVDAQWLRAGSMGTQVFTWADGLTASDKEFMLNRLRSDPDIGFAEFDLQVSPMMTPNDLRFSSQWALKSDTSGGGANFEQAWALTHGSADVVVAVVDTGVVYNTPELSGRLLPGYDFIADVPTANDGSGRDSDASDPGDWVSSADTQTSNFSNCQQSDSSWHGTFIAGQIAANTNNGDGVAAADWNARVLPVRVSGKCRAYSSDMFDGMLWAAGISVPGVPNNPFPADVINVSLGASATCSSFYQSIIDRIEQAGVLVVAAAGNSGGEVYLPANCSKVLSVGAVDRDGSRTFYSAIGPGVDLMAPGGYYSGLVGLGNSGSTSPSNSNYVVNTGTSFSAPLAAAAAGLIKAARPDLTPAQIRGALTGSARAFPSPTLRSCSVGMGRAVCNCNASTCGSGLLDVGAALASVANGRVLANPTTFLADGRIRLDGSESQAPSGRSIASYRWEVVSDGTLFDEAVALLTRPSEARDMFFKLTVTDSVGQSHTSFSAIRVSASGQSSTPTTVPSEAQSTGLGGGGPSPSAPVDSGGGGGGGGGGGSISLFALLLFLLATGLCRRNRPIGLPS